MIAIRPAAWNTQAAGRLSTAAGPDLAAIAAEVTAGQAQLWELPGNSLLVTRLETGTPPCLVLVAGAGRNLLGTVAAFQQLAAEQGLTIRIHSRRPGVCRLLHRLGFSLAGRQKDGYFYFTWSSAHGQ